MPDPFTLVIELGKAREFAAAVGFQDPIGPGSPVPVTFLETKFFWAGPAGDVWPPDRDLSRVLHGEETFTFHGGPLRVGDVLTGLSRVDKVYAKEGKRGGEMTFTEVVTEFRGPDDALRAELRTVTIETGTPAT
jgi:hypothetical protein